MRISDWSSDVCSSDLHAISIGCIDSCRQRLQHIAEVLLAVTPLLLGAFKIGCPAFECLIDAGTDGNMLDATHDACKSTILIEKWIKIDEDRDPAAMGEIGRTACRERVGQYG